MRTYLVLIQHNYRYDDSYIIVMLFIVRYFVLDKEHYEVATFRPLQKCETCGKQYVKTHKCNTLRSSYYNAKVKKGGKRFLLCKDVEEQYNNADEVLHYDIESYQNKKIAGVEEHNIHTPYALGYVIGEEYIELTGENVIRDFVDVLMVKGAALRMDDQCARQKKITRLGLQEVVDRFHELEAIIPKDRTKKQKASIKKLRVRLSKIHKERMLYVNAYNGSNFDHYFIFQEFIRRGYTPDKHIINNGSIISLQYFSIKVMDVCKHLQGSLSDNLHALGCNVQKGEFNHDSKDLLNGWDGMPRELQNDCLKYLEADVRGLKELYDKVNQTTFDKYKVNLSSYISTSSLTFALWKSSIQGKYSIELPTLKQEKAFRESVRGGRTYKSKHRFISKQYEAFKNGEVGFDDVFDYCIDADVVSLYPAAMAQYPYLWENVANTQRNKPRRMVGEWLQKV